MGPPASLHGGDASIDPSAVRSPASTLRNLEVSATFAGSQGPRRRRPIDPSAVRSPGTAETSTGFEDFQLLYFGPGMPAGSGELDDFDLDGRSNLVEYVLGSDPTDSGDMGSVELVTVESGGGDFPGLRYTRPVGLVDVTVTLESSVDLILWQSGPGFTEQDGAPVDNLDGTETVLLRSITPLGAIDREFLRLSMQR